jgi:long-chain acyl-CoA synthetase
MNLVQVLMEKVKAKQDEPALLDIHRIYSWREFFHRVSVLANYLKDKGVMRGGRFAIISRNGFRFEELKWAGFWSGAIPLPINTRLANLEIAQILRDSECQHLMIEATFAHIMQANELREWKGQFTIFGNAAGSEAEVYEDIILKCSPMPLIEVESSCDAILLYTSGTSGESKGVRLSHSNIITNNDAFASAIKANSHQIYLHAAPMFHSADLLAMAWMLQGAPQCFLPSFSPENFIATIKHFKANAVVTVPAMLISVITSVPQEQLKSLSLQKLIYGASPMTLDWIVKVSQSFPQVDLYNCYGQTEASTDLTVFEASEFRLAIEAYLESGLVRDPLLSVGKANSGNQLRVVDQNDQPLKVGEVGELVARGENIMLGYLNKPNETARTLQGGWLHTGDLARIDEQGYIYLLDRLNDRINSGGEGVYSTEVEAVLQKHPAVAEAAVIGTPHERLGETVTAVIVLKMTIDNPEIELADHCRKFIGGFKIPRRFVFAEHLPKNTLGKVLKSELRKNIGIF